MELTPEKLKAMSHKDLFQLRAKLITDNRKLVNDAENGVLSSSQEEEWQKRDKDIDSLSEEIDRRRTAEAKKDRLNKYGELEGQQPHRQTDRTAPAVPDRLTMKFGRHDVVILPTDQLGKRATPEYQEAFDKYLTGGNGDALGLVASKDDKGGYTAPMATTAQLIKFVDDFVFMRQLATVLPPIPEAVSLGAVSYDADPGDADWTAEVPASDISEDDSMRFGKRELRPHLLTKLVKASMKFLRVASGLPGGAAGFIGSRLGYKFAITEEKNFLTGDGVQKPLGVFVASNDGIPTTRDTISTSATDFTADTVMDALYNLKVQYQDRATGLFSRTFIKMLRKKKDGEGQYLWQPGLIAGQPDRILNRPYKQSEFVPSTFTAGLYVGMWADFSWYWILDSLGISIDRLSELFQLKNQTGFLGRKETDGMPVLAEAFSRIRLL